MANIKKDAPGARIEIDDNEDGSIVLDDNGGGAYGCDVTLYDGWTGKSVTTCLSKECLLALANMIKHHFGKTQGYRAQRWPNDGSNGVAKLDLKFEQDESD